MHSCFTARASHFFKADLKVVVSTPMPSIGPVPDADCASSRRECVSGFFKKSKTSRGSGLPKFSKRAVGRMRKKREDAGQKRGPYKKRTGYNEADIETALGMSAFGGKADIEI